MGRWRSLVILLCVAILGAACSRSDDSTGASDSSSSTAPPAAATADFGTLKDVCQPGDAKGATAQGVTDDSIRVATFSDRGFAGRPGLNQELFDSGEVFTKWCNDAGGINGRKLVLDERDAALTDYRARIIDSCQAGLLHGRRRCGLRRHRREGPGGVHAP